MNERKKSDNKFQNLHSYEYGIIIGEDDPTGGDEPTVDSILKLVFVLYAWSSR